MYLIVGLGNPEADYSKTRHNMGFNVINELAKDYEIDVTRTNFQGLYGTGIIENDKVILLKPQTYMNLSGLSVKKHVDFYKIPLENVIVIYDDIDIEPSNIRVRKQGGPGTHNGMKSVVHELNSDNFPRIRVGIGKPSEEEPLVNYVIEYIDEENTKLLKEGTKKAVHAIIEILKNGIDIAMNKFNKD